MIEKIWGKKRILQTYLNVAEMGPGIFGVQAAAKKYFNKDAKNLTRSEAAQIAACLPNPKKFPVKPQSRYVAYRSNNILRQMNNLAGDEDIAKLIRMQVYGASLLLFDILWILLWLYVHCEGTLNTNRQKNILSKLRMSLLSKIFPHNCH